MEEELRLMGFEESAISSAMRKANGNMEIALEILLSNSSEVLDILLSCTRR